VGHEQPHMSSAQRWLVLTQPTAEEVGKPLEQRVVDPLPALNKLPLEAASRCFQLRNSLTVLRRPLGYDPIARTHLVVFDEREETPVPLLGDAKLALHPLEIRTTALIRLVRTLHYGGEQLLQPTGFENTLQEQVEDDRVQFVLADGLARTACGSSRRLRIAGVVAVAASLAGPDGQPGGAAFLATVRDAGQDYGRVGDPRRRDTRRCLGTLECNPPN